MQHLAQRCLGGQTAGQGRHLLNHPGVVAKKSEAKAHGLHFRLPGLQYFVQAGFKLDGFRKKQVLAWGLTRKVVLHHAAIEDALMGRMLVDDHKLPLALAEQVQGKELADKAKPGKLPLAWFTGAWGYALGLTLSTLLDWPSGPVVVLSMAVLCMAVANKFRVRS